MNIDLVIKIAICAVVGLFLLYCAFNAIKHGFRAFLGCIVLAAVGFIAGVYFANKSLFMSYFDIIKAWFL